MRHIITIATALVLAAFPAAAGQTHDIRTSTLTRTYAAPTRIVWQQGDVKGAELLLESKCLGQATLSDDPACTMTSTDEATASILVDFGRELHGALQIVTGGYSHAKQARVRIRFGESVSEACSDIDGINGACNDHAIRDFETLIPWMGVREIGNSGYRFVRIDLLDKGIRVPVREINAVRIDSDIEQIGTFSCSDARLNEIWETGRHTVKLNMQDYIWDGIKRDRLVWVGDMYPEVMTVCNIYGGDSIIPRSLDFSTETNPLPAWINGISAYSMWWVLIQAQWYRYNGDFDYLAQQREYLSGVLRQLAGKVDAEGRERLDDRRFLDWPSQADDEATGTGLHALMMMTMEQGASLCDIIGDSETSALCQETLARLQSQAAAVRDSFLATRIEPDQTGRKQAIALMSLAGMLDDETTAERLLHNGSHGFSTFYGYFMLEALAKAGRYEEAMDIIKEYWGAMIDLGATSFWEDFDIAWMDNAGRIDEMPQEGKVDVHRSYGGYCYQGYRHSLCHGWASGPTSWLSSHVLGLSPASCGQRKVMVDPHLGSLDWAEGSYPTPYGTVSIRVSRMSNGKTLARVRAPRKVRLKAGEGVVIRRLRK